MNVVTSFQEVNPLSSYPDCEFFKLKQTNFDWPFIQSSGFTKANYSRHFIRHFHQLTTTNAHNFYKIRIAVSAPLVRIREITRIVLTSGTLWYAGTAAHQQKHDEKLEFSQTRRPDERNTLATGIFSTIRSDSNTIVAKNAICTPRLHVTPKRRNYFSIVSWKLLQPTWKVRKSTITSTDTVPS